MEASGGPASAGSDSALRDAPSFASSNSWEFDIFQTGKEGALAGAQRARCLLVRVKRTPHTNLSFGDSALHLPPAQTCLRAWRAPRAPQPRTRCSTAFKGPL